MSWEGLAFDQSYAETARCQPDRQAGTGRPGADYGYFRFAISDLRFHLTFKL